MHNIERRNPGLNAFTSVMSEAARAHARRIDDDVEVGKPVGPLAGTPFAVKDLIVEGDAPPDVDALLTKLAAATENRHA